MSKAARNLGREQRRTVIQEKRLADAAAAAEADSPLNRLFNAPTPLARLHALGPVREALMQLEASSVQELRANQVAWSKIGAALGITGQAVQKRYGDLK
jgi:hypothetical protein